MFPSINSSERYGENSDMNVKENQSNIRLPDSIRGGTGTSSKNSKTISKKNIHQDKSSTNSNVPRFPNLSNVVDSTKSTDSSTDKGSPTSTSSNEPFLPSNLRGTSSNSASRSKKKPSNISTNSNAPRRLQSLLNVVNSTESLKKEDSIHKQFYDLLVELQEPCSKIKDLTNRLNTLQQDYRLSLKIMDENERIRKAYAFGKQKHCIDNFLQLINHINRKRFVDAATYPDTVEPFIKIYKIKEQGEDTLDNLQVDFEDFNRQEDNKYSYLNYKRVKDKVTGKKVLIGERMLN